MRTIVRALALFLLFWSVSGQAQDFYKGYESFFQEDFETALEEWRPLAEQGHAGSQYWLGVLYARGIGVPEDVAEAVKWWRSAAEQGHAGAQDYLGWLYYNGIGVPQDNAEAVKWYLLASEQGHAEAIAGLMEMYGSGTSVTITVNGETVDVGSLGTLDPTEMADSYRLAAEQGDASAQFILGAMYYYGVSVRMDDAEAVNWMRLAAEQGHAGAQLILGASYANGRYVPQDWIEATKLYRLAAEQGSPNAQVGLGERYLYLASNDEGDGAIQTFIDAYMWLTIAAIGGNTSAAYGWNYAGGFLSQDDLSTAKVLVQECIQRQYKNC